MTENEKERMPNPLSFEQASDLLDKVLDPDLDLVFVPQGTKIGGAS